MKQTTLYKVAEHVFSITAEEKIFDLMKNYEPFAFNGLVNALVFELEIVSAVGDADNRGDGVCSRVDFVEETRQEDEGQQIACGHTVSGESVFEFFLGDTSTGMLVCSADYRKGRVLVFGKYDKFAINNSLMVLYALATANQMTALFHSAIVSYEGRGYMFLGKSGTGKSTHARLWLNHIAGTELVNDDNPVVRKQGDAFWVYGSPWSGKTPCYRNVGFPLGGIVLLSQAPYNKIRPLQGVEAYVALVTSISGKRWDRNVADGLHQVQNALAMNAKMFYLECLPDEAAAKLCCAAIANK